MPPERARLPKPEDLLNDYARRLHRHRAGRRALWFQLSRLARENRHDSDIQLAANQLRPLANRFQGEVFALASGDVILILKDPDLREIDTAVYAIRYAFLRDPLMQLADREGTHVFLTGYDMADRYDAFLARVNEALASEPADSAAREPTVPAGLGERLVLSRDEMRRVRTAPVAGHINTSQGRIAVERLVERREIASLEGGPKPRRWGLREAVRLEAVDAFDSLAMALARHQVSAASAISDVERTLLPALAGHLKALGEPNHILALRTEALMSPEFVLFDRELGSKTNAKPWIAFWAEELIADKPTVDYLKRFLGERGYRLGVAGLKMTDIPELSGALSPYKFLEIGHPGEIDGREADLLKRLAAHFGSDGVILSDMRSQKALVIARRAGVRLVSGPIVDEAL